MPFAPVHFTTGACVINWGLAGGTDLGFSEDGARITLTPFYDQVHSDDFGGRAGPPSDAQLLGAIATIDVDFTKYVKAELDKLSSFQVNGAAGLLPHVGKFVRQDALAAVLKITGMNEILSFAEAYLKRNFEMNSGTKYRTYRVGWEAWMAKPDYTAMASAQTRRLFTLT